MTRLASIGLCMQSVNFFLYVIFGGRRFVRMILSFVPGFFTAALFCKFLHQNLSVSLFWGHLYCISYQYAFIKFIRKLPKCFTLGEAALVSQGFTLYLFTTILQIPYFITNPAHDDFNKMNSIMMEGIICVLIFVWIVSTIKIFQKTILFYFLLLFFICIIFCIPVTPDLPIVEVLNFILSDSRRIFIIIFYCGMTGLSIATVAWQVNKSEKATTSVRKIFHFLLVVVYIPGLLYQCTFLYISTGVAFCAIILLEFMRVFEIYPFDKILKQSFNVFADEKDAGSVALTPFYLLVGCSAPLWINSSTCGVDNNFIAPNSLLILISGVLTVGIGDTAASVFGSKLGRHKLPNSEKSFEGLIANIILQGLTVAQLFSLNLVVLNNIQISLTAASIIFVAVIEAYTDQVDNIVLPLVFFILANFI
ncbi:dolichol kinase isoform X2 [Condylostylus longicornis]|nr:dolichol kinase isoform X2 [Condylostylus longicornis]